MKKKLICFLLTACFGALAYIHRRVLIAAIKGEESPEAPSWHFWCK